MVTSPSFTRPSELLRELRAAHPGATIPQLADLFVQQFPKVRRTAKRVIWRWRGVETEANYLTDEQVDLLLGEFLRDAGYAK